MNAAAETHRSTPLSAGRLPGFRFAETMTGFLFMDGVRRDMEFRLRAEAPDLREHLRTGETQILGSVDVDGLCRDAPLCGRLQIDLLRQPRRIRYEFTFRAAGRPLRFVGQKDVQLTHLLRTMTHLPGEVEDEDGRVVGHAQLRFRLRTLPAFLASFRPLL